jgi:hypothetical protein
MNWIHRNWSRYLLAPVLFAGLLTLAGCGESGPKVVPASGTVYIDGVPLAYGHIQVMPKGWRPASGRIGGDGRFVLTTSTPNDGCPVGTHPVVILAGESITPETTKWHAPQKYSDASTSNLTVTISGPVDDLKIELKSDGTMKPSKPVRGEGGSEFSK